MKTPDYLYAIDDRPPFGRLCLYGLQWAAIMFPSLIIVAALCGSALAMTVPQQIRFLQMSLLLSGVFSALQTLWGHRYPLLDGPATALLLTFMALAPQGLGVIQGGLMAGGAVLVALGLSGRLAQMARVFTPNVVGVILLLIAFTLLPHLVPRLAGVDEVHPGGEPAILATSLALVVAMAILSRWLRGFWQTVALFLGILLGTLVFALLGRVEWRPVVTAPWAAWPEQWWQQPPRFAWPAVTAFTMAYLAVVANSLGSIQGIANLTDVSRLPAGINRGILMNGLAGICSGLAGVVGMVSYSMSPGVVLVTRVASRYSITACGMTLALAAFLPKLAALLALVPAPVVGAALCVGLAGQVGAGLAILTSHQRTLAARDYLVVGIPVMVGTLVGMLPQGLVAAMPVTARVFLGNGLIVGMLIVLLMEHVLLRPNS